MPWSEHLGHKGPQRGRRWQRNRVQRATVRARVRARAGGRRKKSGDQVGAVTAPKSRKRQRCGESRSTSAGLGHSTSANGEPSTARPRQPRPAAATQSSSHPRLIRASPNHECPCPCPAHAGGVWRSGSAHRPLASSSLDLLRTHTPLSLPDPFPSSLQHHLPHSLFVHSPECSNIVHHERSYRKHGKHLLLHRPVGTCACRRLLLTLCSLLGLDSP